MEGEWIIGIMAILNLFHRVRMSGGADIRAGKFHMQLRKPFHADLNRIDSIQLQSRIQYRTSLLIAVGRSIRPAAAPVHAHRKLHIHSVLRNPIIFYCAQTGSCIIKNRLLNGIKAKSFHKIIPGLAKDKTAFLHILCYSIENTDFKRKIGMFRVLHEQRKNFFVNAMGSEGFQRIFIVDSGFQLP